jgi:hypothetical protein
MYRIRCNYSVDAEVIREFGEVAEKSIQTRILDAFTSEMNKVNCLKTTSKEKVVNGEISYPIEIEYSTEGYVLTPEEFLKAIELLKEIKAAFYDTNSGAISNLFRILTKEPEEMRLQH